MGILQTIAISNVFFEKARPQQNTHGPMEDFFPYFQSHSPGVSGQVPASKLWCSGDCRCGGLGIVVFCFCLDSDSQIMSGKDGSFFGKRHYYLLLETSHGSLNRDYWRMGVRFCVKENVSMFICFCVNSFNENHLSRILFVSKVW